MFNGNLEDQVLKEIPNQVCNYMWKAGVNIVQGENDIQPPNNGEEEVVKGENEVEAAINEEEKVEESRNEDEENKI